METAFVFFFASTSIVSTLAFLVELHLRIKRENELNSLLDFTASKFVEWRNKRKEKLNGDKRNKKPLPAKQGKV